MKWLVAYTVLLIFQGFTFAGENNSAEVCLSREEKILYDLITQYRKERGLYNIPLSGQLTIVAQTHAQDLAENFQVNFNGVCNLHSWSAKGKWKYCCYTDDHRHAGCMWAKPKEITGYDGSGYEIAYYKGGGTTAQLCFSAWKMSPGHSPLINNEGTWSKLKWKGIGIGICGDYGVVWFGDASDTSGISDCL